MKRAGLSFIAFASLILLSSPSFADEVVKEGGFFKAKCTCQCLGVNLEATALYNPGFGISDAAATAEAKIKCQEQCARICGGYTDCIENDEKACKTCCSDYCSSDYGGSSKEPCKQSCTSTCSYKGLIRGITDIIYSVAGVIAALMIVIHGIRMATAQDAADRNAAKSSIVYVVLALIVIILAGSLVNLFMASVSVPDGGAGPAGPPTLGCSDCGGNPAACTAASCHSTYGCWFKASTTECLECSGIVDACSGYDLLECAYNPCGLPGGCKVEGLLCEPAGSSTVDCSTCGGGGTCTLPECHAINGCYFTYAYWRCLPCASAITRCEDYPMDASQDPYGEVCRSNPCKVPGGCKSGFMGCEPA